MKKFILTIILSTGLVGAILTSCLCKNIPEHWMPESMSAKVINLDSEQQPYQVNDTITSDSILIKLDFEHNYLAQNNNDFNIFGNAAFASQKCPAHGHQGIKYNVNSFKLTSNKDFDSIPAGSDLSHLIYLKQEVYLNQEAMNSNYTETFLEIDEGLVVGFYKNFIRFTLKHKPASVESRYFTLTWTFENNQVMSCYTQPIVW